MNNEIKCIKYKEANRLYHLLSEMKEPWYQASMLNLDKMSESLITNMLFNYLILAFTKERENHTEIILYRLPTLEENGTITTMLISDADKEFIEESIRYIKKIFSSFRWNKIVLEIILNGDEEYICQELTRCGFTKNMELPFAYGSRALFSVVIDL